MKKLLVLLFLLVTLVGVVPPAQAQPDIQQTMAVTNAMIQAAGCPVGMNEVNGVWVASYSSECSSAQQTTGAAELAVINSPTWTNIQNGAAAYQAALSAGVPISCAPGATVCTSAVAATYPLTGPVYNDLKDAALWTKAYGALPTTASTLALTLSSTITVTFSSPAQLEEVSMAVALYLVALKQAYVASQAGGAWSPPAMPAPLP